MVRKSLINDILDKQEADLVVNYVLSRKKKGLYTLVFVAGLPGSGKTSTCFRIGELLTEKYYGKNTMTSEKILDSFLDLTKFVIDADPKELCVAIIEEVSVLFPSRRAMSGVNVDLARLLDTCRKKQIVLLANAPLWTSIDSHMKSMGSVYIETKKIYKQSMVVYSKMFRLQTNPRTGKTYTHSLHRGGKDVRKMYTKMPNTDEWIKYESRKDVFMNKLYDKLVIRENKRAEKERKELKIPERKPLTKKQEMAMITLANIKEDNKTERAGKILKIDPSCVSLHKKLAEKKGYKVSEFVGKKPIIEE